MLRVRNPNSLRRIVPKRVSKDFSKSDIRTAIVQAKATLDPKKALLAEGLTAKKLKLYGLSATMLHSLKFSLLELIAADYEPFELVEAGYPAGEVLSVVNSLANLRRLGKKALQKKQNK